MRERRAAHAVHCQRLVPIERVASGSANGPRIATQQQHLEPVRRSWPGPLQQELDDSRGAQEGIVRGPLLQPRASLQLLRRPSRLSLHLAVNARNHSPGIDGARCDDLKLRFVCCHLLLQKQIANNCKRNTKFLNREASAKPHWEPRFERTCECSKANTWTALSNAAAVSQETERRQ